MKVIGLMSGTSLDGIDAALIEIRDTAPDEEIAWDLLAFHTRAYDADRRGAIHQSILHGDAASLCRLNARLGEWFAEAALAVCEAAGTDPTSVDLIGSHGQTVWHQPPTASERGSTLQLGDASTIAERTGIDVVSDFRSRDMAAGGEGAPLVPWVDHLLFAGEHTRVLQNIGGMANLTRVPARGSNEPLVAFDTGPGNALIDCAVELGTAGASLYDHGGGLATRGRVDTSLVDELLDDEYFRRPPPKSTGREKFGRAFVDALVQRRTPEDEAAWADLVATLTAFTARSIADAVKRWADPGPRGEVVLTGGGSRNPALVAMIRDALAPIPVSAANLLGFEPAAKEAVAFAFLAWAHATGRAGNLAEVTGAAGRRVLGSFTPGRRAHVASLRGPG